MSRIDGNPTRAAGAAHNEKMIEEFKEGKHGAGKRQNAPARA